MLWVIETIIIISLDFIPYSFESISISHHSPIHIIHWYCVHHPNNYAISQTRGKRRNINYEVNERDQCHEEEEWREWFSCLIYHLMVFITPFEWSISPSIISQHPHFISFISIIEWLFTLQSEWDIIGEREVGEKGIRMNDKGVENEERVRENSLFGLWVIMIVFNFITLSP